MESKETAQTRSRLDDNSIQNEKEWIQIERQIVDS